MKKNRILVIGGDLRITKMAEELSSDGFCVSLFSNKDTLKGSLDNSDIIILGLPCSRDDETIDAACLDSPIYIKDLFRLMNHNQLLLGGKFSEHMKALADVYSIRWVDYFKREELEILNAIPTSEGAIQLAMEELPITLHGSNALVLGYGRIGKILSKMLYSLGAHVTVCARKYSDFALINANNLNPMPYSKLKDCINNYDVIFNTVPAMVLDRSVLAVVKNDILVIDLASKPGGVDFDAAKDLGINIIWALSLPGKVAPISAGKIIKDTIYNIFNELGV